MRLKSLLMITALTTAASLQLGMAQQQSAFNPATFEWTNPANWEVSMNASGGQVWTLRDPAARAYNQQATQAGQFCVYSFMRGTRALNLRIPKISPECQRRG